MGERERLDERDGSGSADARGARAQRVNQNSLIILEVEGDDRSCRSGEGSSQVSAELGDRGSSERGWRTHHRKHHDEESARCD